MSTKHQRLFTSFLLAACIFMSACSTTSVNGKPGLLNIQEQGSFAVGGTVITNSGTFDPVGTGFWFSRSARHCGWNHDVCRGSEVKTPCCYRLGPYSSRFYVHFA